MANNAEKDLKFDFLLLGWLLLKSTPILRLQLDSLFAKVAENVIKRRFPPNAFSFVFHENYRLDCFTMFTTNKLSYSATKSAIKNNGFCNQLLMTVR